MATRFNPTTKNGHNMFDMASMMQKAIRRSDVRRAAYAAYELYGNYYSFMWKRLLVSSAEDCWGIMTKEIIALKEADEVLNKGKTGYQKDPLFVAKAVTLLCMAKKNRDACYVACNFMTSEDPIPPEQIEHISMEDLGRMQESDIPDWVYDVHTLKGKRNGKTEVDMGEDEQKALKPHQLGLFDYGDWSNHDKKRQNITQKEKNFLQETYNYRVLNPTEIQEWEDKVTELNKRIKELELKVFELS